MKTKAKFGMFFTLFFMGAVYASTDVSRPSAQKLLKKMQRIPVPERRDFDFENHGESGVRELDITAFWPSFYDLPTGLGTFPNSTHHYFLLAKAKYELRYYCEYVPSKDKAQDTVSLMIYDLLEKTSKTLKGWIEIVPLNLHNDGPAKYYFYSKFLSVVDVHVSEKDPNDVLFGVAHHYPFFGSREEKRRSKSISWEKEKYLSGLDWIRVNSSNPVLSEYVGHRIRVGEGYNKANEPIDYKIACWTKDELRRTVELAEAREELEWALNSKEHLSKSITEAVSRIAEIKIELLKASKEFNTYSTEIDDINLEHECKKKALIEAPIPDECKELEERNHYWSKDLKSYLLSSLEYDKALMTSTTYLKGFSERKIVELSSELELREKQLKIYNDDEQATDNRILEAEEKVKALFTNTK